MAIDLPDPPFAAETENTIRTRMLTAVAGSFNKAEGDFVWDMLTPAAAEMDQVYDQLQITLDECFVSTASGAYLDALGLQLTGMTRTVDETDTSFRNRLLARLEAPVGAGNEADYKVWAMTVSGIGFVTVEPAWSGAGTVRVLIARSDRTVASGTDVTNVGNYISTVMPAGVTLTVSTISLAAITFALSVTRLPNFALATVSADIETRVRAYVDTLGPGDDVLRNEVIAAAMEAEGVYDVTAATLDGSSTNRAVASTDLATVSTVNVT